MERRELGAQDDHRISTRHSTIDRASVIVSYAVYGQLIAVIVIINEGKYETEIGRQGRKGEHGGDL
jgi:hypothetical protein